MGTELAVVERDKTGRFAKGGPGGPGRGKIARRKKRFCIKSIRIREKLLEAALSNDVDLPGVMARIADEQPVEFIKLLNSLLQPLKPAELEPEQPKEQSNGSPISSIQTVIEQILAAKLEAAEHEIEHPMIIHRPLDQQ